MSMETALQDVKKVIKKFVSWIDGHFGLANYVDSDAYEETHTKPTEAANDPVATPIPKTDEVDPQTPK